MACDGFITFKILELILSIFCIIFKRVTDDKSNKLFYYLQKQSREWPLLNNIFWDQNGAIFADMTYGGYVVICTGLIIGQAAGELGYARYTENFLLTMGALMYFGAASLELAALDSVEPNLVVNAAVLGVVSLITGLIFILDLLLAARRRKRNTTHVRTLGYDKPTQTEQKTESIPSAPTNDPVFKKVPTNGVKILPSSPMMEPTQMYPHIPVTNSNNEFIGTIPAPVYTAQELKSPKVKIQSTESFLRSEKGHMPMVRKREKEEPIFVPPGYVLVQAKATDNSAHTPPGYASVEQKNGMITPRKLQSPTITTTAQTPTGYYYQDSREPSPVEDDQANSEFGKYQMPVNKPWSLGQKSKAFTDQPDSPFRRNAPFRSSKQNLARYDLAFPPDHDRESLNGHKIDEELRRIRNVTRTDADLAAEIERENKTLKDVLKKEQEEKNKLKSELKKVGLEERQRLEDRVNELEEYQAKLEKELKIEERKKLEKKIRELEDEKDRRMSENVQYFGVNDIRQSKRESSPVIEPKLTDIEEYFKAEAEKSKGVKEINAKLKEKHSDEELKRVIEEGFNFLDEEERKKRSEQIFKEVEEHRNQQKRDKDVMKTLEWKDDDIPSRGGTPGGASFKSEAQFWLDGSREERPLSPKDPGYVLHTVRSLQDQASPGDRYRFSPRKANQSFKFVSVTPSPELPAERGSSEEEERGRGPDRSNRGRGKGMLLRKVDFPAEDIAVEIERPNTVAGNTSSWRRWLQNPSKTKLHSTRSTPA